jgi:hypothetical protein
MAAILCLPAWPLWAAEPTHRELYLTDPSDQESVIETFLAPGEFSDRRVVHVSSGEEATYSLDSSLGATKPFAELHPERLSWPDLAGLKLMVEGGPLTLTPTGDECVTDELLDRGFSIRWVMAPLGQRFEPVPHFALKVVSAEVLGEAGGKRLLFWSEPPSPPVCARGVKEGRPNCRLDGVGQEARALALSPDGRRLALAFGGLRPRLELYDVGRVPRLLWQVLFSKSTGGAIETAFSADGEWVVALTGRGRMHRFDAKTGGRHLSIPSEGRTASAVPPGEVMAVAGESGAVKLWYLADGTIAWRLPPRRARGAVDRLAASGDGRRFATLEYAEERTVVRVWTLGTRSVMTELEVASDAIVDIALDESGNTLYLSHETEGLLAAPVRRPTAAKPLKGESAGRCRGRLQWISGENTLSCATKRGELRIDGQGRFRRSLHSDGATSDWIVKASASGNRLAAVGGGRLLVWWTK